MKRDFLENLGLDENVIQQILDENCREKMRAGAVRRAVGNLGLKFSSKAAERDFFAQLDQKNLQWIDGELVGLDGFLRERKDAEPDAFVSARPVPRFAAPSGPGCMTSGLTPPNIAQARAMGAEKAAAMLASRDIIKHFV